MKNLARWTTVHLNLKSSLKNKNKTIQAGWGAALLLLALSGCLPPALPLATQPNSHVSTPTQLPSIPFTSTPNSTPTPTRHPVILQASLTPLDGSTASPTLTSPAKDTPPLTSICSPLEGVRIADLDSPDLLKNPYNPARPGYDNGHPGIDLSYWTRPDGEAMLGLPVHSVLDGVVAAALPKRQPFGNALIIETNLDRLPANWLAQLHLPLPRHDLQPSYSLSCPDFSDFNFPAQQTSIYLLYAHLNHPTNLLPGDPVACGQSVGQVGTTGNSINPHLHLEARHGPAGVIFASMDHYDNAATLDEMRSYCIWRISGAFQAFDPLKLFALAQAER